ncbi:hypothetical protein J2W14_003405 [Pseudarthrobacter oxydans]|uniref:hypothetical protein n=1 Tax=Pseudarthrobacter oxydans TaxID=1671 RepID=UPI002782A79A|nr:hypothetical protein [Pseudarthrobacter oxydans]MDP9983982.1 hypothetical protein [Pseudarthrobacter oxydans]
MKASFSGAVGEALAASFQNPQGKQTPLMPDKGRAESVLLAARPASRRLVRVKKQRRGRSYLARPAILLAH